VLTISVNLEKKVPIEKKIKVKNGNKTKFKIINN